MPWKRWLPFLFHSLSLLLPIHAAGTSSTTDEFRGSSLLPFHLMDSDGSCLASHGGFGPCDEGALWSYVPRHKNDGRSLVAFLETQGEKSCFAREGCRKARSTLTTAKCGSCGAKHWELVRDRKSGKYLLMANDRKQCFVREAQSFEVKQRRLALQKKKKKDEFNPKSPSLFNSAVVQPCDKGTTLLQLVERPFHDAGFFMQASDGACFAGVGFQACNSKASSQIWGAGLRFSGKGEAVRFLYKWHDSTKCLVRDGSTARFGSCDEKGAKGWGLRDGRLTQNEGKDCLVRGITNTAHVVSCSTGYEHLSLGFPQSAAVSYGQQQQQQQQQQQHIQQQHQQQRQMSQQQQQSQQPMKRYR